MVETAAAPGLRAEGRVGRLETVGCEMLLERAYDFQSVLVPCNEAAVSKQIFPVLVLHGLQCDLTFARLLAFRLDTMPVFGYQGVGIDGVSPPLDTMDAIVALFIDAALAIYPKGPFILAAFCAGAKVALEMADRLQASGHEVKCVYLIDAPHRMAPGQFEELIREQIEIAERRLQVLAEFNRKTPGAPATIRAFGKALRAHTPKPYAGQVHILVTQQSRGLIFDKTLGWAGLLRRDTRVRVVAHDRDDLLQRRMPLLAQIIRTESAQ